MEPSINESSDEGRPDGGTEGPRTLPDEAAYDCPACGEEIVVPVDPSAGPRQSYGEDCPVCCRPVRIAVEFDADGGVWCRAEAE